MCRWLQVAEYCPQLCLEWLSQQVMRTKVAHTWALENLRTWVEPFLIAHNNARVRQTTAMLLVALVPSSYFRQGFRQTRSPCKEKVLLSDSSLLILHDIYAHLLDLLGPAKAYTGKHLLDQHFVKACNGKHLHLQRVDAMPVSASPTVWLLTHPDSRSVRRISPVPLSPPFTAVVVLVRGS